MNCSDVRALEDAFLDGELELARQLEVEAHLEACVDCPRRFEARRALHTALETSDLYYAAPAHLERRIRGQLAAHTVVAPRSSFAGRGRAWITFAGVGALLLLAASALTVLMTQDNATDVIAGQVISSHVRSLQPGHLTDIASSEHHTVKPWFAGRVDFSPPVVDLEQEGFPLVGGRLDSIDGRTVAALVYRRGQHLVNVFLWPASGDSAPHTLHLHGYNLVHWSRAGFTGWAASDLNPPELGQFVNLLVQRAAP